jgi:hypothetical protein
MLCVARLGLMAAMAEMLWLNSYTQEAFQAAICFAFLALL